MVVLGMDAAAMGTGNARSPSAHNAAEVSRAAPATTWILFETESERAGYNADAFEKTVMHKCISRQTAH